MKRLLTLSEMIIAMLGCVNVQYIGDEFESTSDIKLYYSEEDIIEPHTIIGTALGRSKIFPHRTIKRALIKKARQKGADAILILGLSVDQKKISQVERSLKP
jgi:hypothetical protein